MMNKVLPASPDSIRQAAAAVERGQVIVIPTDTVYGLACRLDRPEAVDEIFRLKGRPESLALPVLVSDLSGARELGTFSDQAEALAEVFWPGALTLVVPRAKEIRADLGGDGTTVGLRVPSHDFVLDLLQSIGPLAATSANRTGEQTPQSVPEIVELFEDEVSLYIDGGPARQSLPSTVVSVVEEPKLLREGSVGWSEIVRLL